MYASPQAVLAPAHQAKAPILQRRCACGGEVGPTGECAACRANRMQKQAESNAPPIVHDVLRSPGSPLDSQVRGEMEQRFGFDFRQVRIHSDARAAASASAVNAQAYTVGPNVVFDRGAFAPQSVAGKQLLAHELAHVTQQQGPIPGSLRIQPANAPHEAEANRMSQVALSGGSRMQQGGRSGPAVARTFSAGASNCAAGRNSAPADVDTELPAMDTRAGEIAAEVATALEADPVDASVRTALEGRFGLPPVFANGRSINRLTGAGVADQDTAIAGELRILARRFRFSTRTFAQTIFYRCVGPDGGSSISGCTVNNALCAGGSAFSCRGASAIFMCPDFWTRFATTDERALVLMHESFHINFGSANPSIQGEVGEQTQGGSGGRYNNASCYESFASDITGVTVADTCPAVAP